MGKDPRDINSPDSPEISEGIRGRILGVTRFGGRAGFIAFMALAILIGLIIYGITAAGNHASQQTAQAPQAQPNTEVTPFGESFPNGTATLPPEGNRVVQNTPIPLPSAEKAQPTLAPVTLPTLPPPVEAQLGNREVSSIPTISPQQDAELRQRDQAVKAGVLVSGFGAGSGGAGGGSGAPGAGGAAQGGAPEGGAGQGGPPGGPGSGDSATPDYGGQANKLAFITKDAAASNQSNYNPYYKADMLSPYELKAGTFIPGALITGINSDLPGIMIAQVRQNVYDSRSGRYLLIPQGAKLIGNYDSRVVYGQTRVLVVWNRIIFPDASSINIGGMEGSDTAGYSGFSGHVNDHFNRALNAALLLSVITAAVSLSSPQQGALQAPSASQQLSSSLGTELSQLSIQVIDKQLNIQPTIEVPQGYKFDIIVDKDVVLPEPWHGV